MSAQLLVQPYLFFEGRCEEAATFYVKLLGAEITMLMRVKDNPEPQPPSGEGCSPPPGSENKVLHMALRIGGGTVFCSDGMNSGQAPFQGFSLSINVPDEAEAERVFAGLADGGEVRMPLAKTFFSPKFGMVADRFGVPWMVIVGQ